MLGNLQHAEVRHAVAADDVQGDFAGARDIVVGAGRDRAAEHFLGHAAGDQDVQAVEQFALVVQDLVLLRGEEGLAEREAARQLRSAKLGKLGPSVMTMIRREPAAANAAFTPKIGSLS